MDSNPSPYRRLHIPREPFTSSGSQGSRSTIPPHSNPPTGRLLNPTREQMSALHQQSPTQSFLRTSETRFPNHAHGFQEPRCTVPPEPHVRRGIRSSQHHLAPPLPVDAIPPVPTIPQIHRNSSHLRERPVSMNEINIASQTQGRRYSNEEPRPPMDHEDYTFRSGVSGQWLPNNGQVAGQDGGKRRGSLGSGLSAKLQKRRKSSC